MWCGDILLEHGSFIWPMDYPSPRPTRCHNTTTLPSVGLFLSVTPVKQHFSQGDRLIAVTTNSSETGNIVRCHYAWKVWNIYSRTDFIYSSNGTTRVLKEGNVLAVLALPHHVISWPLENDRWAYRCQWLSTVYSNTMSRWLWWCNRPTKYRYFCTTGNGKSKIYPISYPLGKNAPFNNLYKLIFNWAKVI